MGILAELGKVISARFGVNPKPAESLEEAIQLISDEKAKIKPTKDDIDNFGWITKDNNPVHKYEDVAKMRGFNGVPLMGAHLSAYGEQFVERAIEKMREYWQADIKTIGQITRFKSAVYPGDKIHWSIGGHRQEGEDVGLEVLGKVKDSKVVEVYAKLGNTYPLMPQIAGPIFSRDYVIDEEHIREFYRCVGESHNGKVPNTLPTSFVPATLLNLLEKKTGEIEGTNLSMDFRYMSEPKAGQLRVDLFPTEPRERNGSFLYKFRVVCSQGTNPIAYGEVLSSMARRICI